MPAKQINSLKLPLSDPYRLNRRPGVTKTRNDSKGKRCKANLVLVLSL